MTDEVENVDGIFEDAKVPEYQETEQKGVKESTPPVDKENKTINTKDAEKESEVETQEQTVPLKALLEARRKTHELEDRLAKIEQLNAPPAEAPNPVTNPNEYEKFIEKKLTVKELESRINNSRSEMLGQHADYEDMEDTFLFITRKNPGLITEMNKHPEPARFAYEKGKEHMQVQRQKIEAEILTATQGNQVKDFDKRKASATGAPDLTGATAIGKNSSAVSVLPSVKELFTSALF